MTEEQAGHDNSTNAGGDGGGAPSAPSSSSSSTSRRVLLIGLDGMTFDVVEPFAERGVMPTMKSLMDRGTWGVLESVTPPVTGPAWVSIVTGKQPGNHGIFDFFKPTKSNNAVGMSRRIVNAREVDGKPIWRLLTERDKTSIVMNVPVTYPPAPIKGAMMTGMLTPSTNVRFTHPPDLYDRLRADLGEYTITVNWQGYSEATAEQFVDDVIRCAEDRTNYALRLMDEFPDWDLCFPCYTEPDRIQHALWNYLDPNEREKLKEAGRYRQEVMDRIEEFYRRIDGHIAQLLEKTGPDVPVFFCSDHGFGPLHGKYFVNTFLEREGLFAYRKAKIKKAMAGLLARKVWHKFLKTIGFGDVVKRAAAKKAEARQSTDNRTFYDVFYESIDWERTRVYMASNTEGGIYLNVKGRKMYGADVDRGAIEPEDYESERARIMEAIKKIRNPHTGKPMVTHLFTREQIYTGKYVERAPDIVFFLDDGEWIADFTLEKGLYKDADWRTGCGMHRLEGLFLAAGPGIAHRERIQTSIPHVVPTVLAAMGLPIPDDMDGRAIDEVFTDEWKSANAITYEGDSAGEGQGWGQGEDVFQDEEEELLVERLRSLGYLD